MSRHDVVPSSLLTATRMTQQVLLKIPRNTRNGCRYHSTTNLASPPKCRQHTNGTPHPCKCQRNDKNELQSIQTSACRANDTSLTTFAHAVLNCILGLNKSCSPVKISACFSLRIPLLLHDQTVTVESRAWTETAQPPKLQGHKPNANNNSNPNSNIISFERRTVKKHVLNRLWIQHCVCSQKLTLKTAKENIISRGVSSQLNKTEPPWTGTEQTVRNRRSQGNQGALPPPCGPRTNTTPTQPLSTLVDC